MLVECRRFPQYLVMALAAWGAAQSAKAELADDVTEFLKAHDELVAMRAEISADRTALADDPNKTAHLKNDVVEFFSDRIQAALLRLQKSVERKNIKRDIKFHPTAVLRTTAGAGDLSKDTAKYLKNFDAWVALGNEIEADTEQMRLDLGGGNQNALANSALKFLQDERARLKVRLQWQSDLKAMKKDAGFVGTGNPVPPDGKSLKEVVSEFLTDRAAWDALRAQIDADRNNLRAVLSDPESLDSAVFTFLTDKGALRVKGQELFLDRRAMSKIAHLGFKLRERTPGTLLSASSENLDDEDPEVEESADESGA